MKSECRTQGSKGTGAARREKTETQTERHRKSPGVLLASGKYSMGEVTEELNVSYTMAGSRKGRGSMIRCHLNPVVVL